MRRRQVSGEAEITNKMRRVLAKVRNREPRFDARRHLRYGNPGRNLL
jgi:hypothetical protein